MKLNIHGDKMEITNAIKKYIAEKLERIEKYFQDPKNTEVKVTTKVLGRNQIIEVTIISGGLTLRAEESNENLYSAIDLVSEKLEGQIRKNKARIKKHLKEENLKTLNLEFEEDLFDDMEAKEEIKYSKIEEKPMTVEEAILQMNLMSYDFLVFKNSETEKTSVVYKRKDNNYGVFE